MSWERHQTICPVTALYIAPSLTKSVHNVSVIYAGIGPDLYAYDMHSSVLLFRKESLPTSVVHGIRESIEVSQSVGDHKCNGSTSKQSRYIVTFGQKQLGLTLASHNHSYTDKAQVATRSKASCSENVYVENQRRENDRHHEMILDSPQRMQQLTVELAVLQNITFSDMICDAKLLLDSDNISNLTIAVGFAHNFVEIWRVNSKSVERTCTHRLQCDVRCLLYSLSFYGGCASDLVVASGTIFNQIVIWDPFGNGMASQTINGHQGVLFSVTWSDGGTRIASTSDDRTLRTWQRSGKQDCKSDILTSSFVPVYTAYGHTARVWDSVFLPSLGPNHVASVAEDGTCCIWNGEGTQLAVLSGHILKNIWSVATDRSASILVTGGGDGAIKVWDVARYTSKALIPIDQHAQKLSLSEEILPATNFELNWLDLPASAKRVNAVISDEACKYLYVATAAGTCLRFNLNESRCSGSSAHERNSFVEIFDLTAVARPKNLPHRKEALCCITLSKDKRYLLGGDTSGRCHIFPSVPEKERNTSASSIMSWDAHRFRCWKVQWERGRRTAEQKSTISGKCMKDSYVLTFGAEGQVCVWQLNRMNEGTGVVQFSVPTLQCSAQIDALINSNQQSTTTTDAAEISAGVSARAKRKRGKGKKKHQFSPSFCSAVFKEGILFAGDNCGGVSAWSGEDSSLYWYGHNLHRRDQVRWIGLHDKYVVSGGCDGRVIMYHLKYDPSEEGKKVFSHLMPVKIRKAGSISTVESVSWTLSGNMIAVGFVGNFIIVHNISLQYELFRRECGGWRRPFDVHFSFMPKLAHQGPATIIYVPTYSQRKSQAKKRGRTSSVMPSASSDPTTTCLTIQVCRCQPNPPLVTFDKASIHAMFHGRVATSIRWLGLNQDRSKYIFATGSEDNSIMLHTFTPLDKNGNSTKSSIEHIDSSDVHSSAVRALFALPKKEHIRPHTLLFSAGGNNMLCCWKIYESEGSHPALHLMATYRQRTLVQKGRSMNRGDEDCRFMSIVAMPMKTKENSVIIFCGSSQGSISAFRLDLDSGLLELVHTFGHRGSSCKPILCIGHNADIMDVYGNLIFTGSTDGTVTVWDISWALKGLKVPQLGIKPLLTMALHSMGVNCLVVWSISETPASYPLPKLAVASGGDDNAVSCVFLEYTAMGKICEVAKCCVPSACASALKSIWAKDSHIFTVGWNQRLTSWRLRKEGDKIQLNSELTYYASTFINVPDVSGMDIFIDNEGCFKVAVVGQGIEALSLSVK